jgi:hypothetical protein
MLVGVLLFLIAGWFISVLLNIRRLFSTRYAVSRHFRLMVIMGNQDPVAEGFLRKLLIWRDRLWPRLEVVVIDCSGSFASTGKVIRLLAGQANFTVVNARERGFWELASVFESREKGSTVWCYDTRLLKGQELLRTSLFSLLVSI